jgi:hypothetical protein
LNRQSIPLSQRRGDIVILAFFIVNLLFITYFVDLEQLVIADTTHFTYPIWPPAPAVDLMHRWGSMFDPLLMARPAWWKMTIWIDALAFGPFYAVAIFAYLKGKEWIRIPSIIYGSVMLTNVTIILGDEYAGVHKAPNFLIVLLENLPWLLFPLYIIYRMWRYPHPFTRPAGEKSAGTPVADEQAEALGGAG